MTRAAAQQRARDRVYAEIMGAVRDACARAVRDPGRIERVVLFGSFARGDFDGLSDIDIAVIGARDAFDSRAFAAIDRPVDVIALPADMWHRAEADGGGQTDPMIDVIRSEAIPLWP